MDLRYLKDNNNNFIFVKNTTLSYFCLFVCLFSIMCHQNIYLLKSLYNQRFVDITDVIMLRIYRDSSISYVPFSTLRSLNLHRNHFPFSHYIILDGSKCSGPFKLKHDTLNLLSSTVCSETSFMLSALFLKKITERR